MKPADKDCCVLVFIYMNYVQTKVLAFLISLVLRHLLASAPEIRKCSGELGEGRVIFNIIIASTIPTIEYSLEFEEGRGSQTGYSATIG